MRIIKVGLDESRPVERFGSRGLHAKALLRGDHLAVTILRVAAGGEIGRHPAVTDQVFLVVEGRGKVCGEDGVWQPISVGEAAFWDAGEAHTTQAHEDLTAVVIEMAGLSGQLTER